MLLQAHEVKRHEFKRKRSLGAVTGQWVVYSEVASANLDGHLGKYGRCVVAVKYGKVVDTEACGQTQRAVVCDVGLGYRPGVYSYPITDVCILSEPVLLRCLPGLTEVSGNERLAVLAAITDGCRPPFGWVHRQWLQKELRIQLQLLSQCSGANKNELVLLEDIVSNFTNFRSS